MFLRSYSLELFISTLKVEPTAVQTTQIKIPVAK